MFYQTRDFIEKFVILIRECNKIVLDIYNSDFSVSIKSDNTPLTMADKKCNEHICDFLKKNYGAILLISEENKKISYQKRRLHDLCWLIDPIDGTKEFVKRNGQFTINIGLCKKGVPVFGIVSIPVTGEIYYGAEGIGSFKLENVNRIKLKINKKNFTKPNLNIVASASHLNIKTSEFIKLFKEPNIVTVGSSIKLLWIAEGKADIYPRLALTSEWDTCAAHADVKYSGGNVIKYSGVDSFNQLNKKNLNKEVTYNKEDILNPFFIVY